MAKTTYKHTFNLLSQFRDALDLAVSTIQPQLESELERVDVSYEDIVAAVWVDSDGSNTNETSGLHEHLDNLKLQIIYSHVLQHAQLEPYYSCIQTLRDALRDDKNIEEPGSYSQRWINALRLTYKFTLKPNFHKTSIDNKHHSFARAVAYFNRLNIDVRVHETEVVFPSSSVKLAALETICIPLRALGSHGAMNYLGILLQSRYDPRINRLKLHSTPDALGQKVERQIPYGLIYRLALKSLGIKKKDTNPVKLSERATESARNFAALHDVEPFTIYELMFPPKPKYFIRHICRITEFDELFSIPQCHPDVIESLLTNLITSLFSTLPIPNLNWCISDVLKLWKLTRYICSDPYKSAFVNRNTFELELRKLVGEFTAKALISSFVISQPNKHYFYPTDAFKGDTRECCIVEAASNEYWLPGNLIFAPAFFSRLIRVLVENTPDFNTKLGVAFEEYLVKRMEAIGITCRKGIIKGTKKGETAGDIDLVLETNETIALFELKKKTMCRASTAGDGLQLAIDISHGLVHGAEQLAKHEIALIRDKKLEFSEGLPLELNDRRILKFVISLGDFGSLHDSNVTNYTLQMLAGAKFNIKNVTNKAKKREVELSAKYCQKLHDRYFEYKDVHGDTKADLFANLSFKNIFFIEYLLTKERSAEAFLSSLMRGSRTSFGTRDPFVEHALLTPWPPTPVTK